MSYTKVRLFCLHGILWLGFCPLVAQDALSASPSELASVAALEVPSTATIQALLETIQADGNLAQASKEALISELEQALAHLAQAKAHQQKREQIKQLAQTAPEQEQKLLTQLEKFSVDESAQEAQESAQFSQANTQELEQEMRLEEASLGQLETQLEGVHQELAQIIERPRQLGERMPLVAQELESLQAELALALQTPQEQASNSQLVQIYLLQTKQAALQSELELLDEEQINLGIQERLLKAQEQLLERRVQAQQDKLSSLQQVLQKNRLKDAQNFGLEVESLQQAIAEAEVPDSERKLLEELGAQLQNDAQRLSKETLQVEKLQAQTKSMSARFERAQTRFERLQEQLALSGLESTFGQTLLSEYRALGNAQELEHSLKEMQRSIREMRLAEFELEDRIGEQEAWEAKLNGIELPVKNQLLENRESLLKKLQQTRQVQIQETQTLIGKTRSLHGLIIEFQDFLHEKLFWTRSSPAMDFADVRAIPSALSWLFSAQHAQEVKQFFRNLPRERPLAIVVSGFFVCWILLFGLKIKKNLVESAKKIRRVRTDHYLYTLQALGLTILLALPPALVLGFLGWAMQVNSAGISWLQGLGAGLFLASWFLGFVWFLVLATAKRGLAQAHFLWSETFCQTLRRRLLPLSVGFVFFLLFSYICLYALEAQFLRSLGRLSFLLAQGVLALALWQLVGGLLGQVKAQPSCASHQDSKSNFTGIEGLPKQGAKSWKQKLSVILLGILLFMPVANALLGLAGFTIGAIALNEALLGSLCFIGAGMILYSLLLRWFLVKQRKLALQELLEERRAKREAALAAAEQEGESTNEGEEMFSIEVEESELDLEETVSQTKRLLRSLSIIGVILVLWWYWERSLPLEEFLRDQTLGSWISLLGIAQAGLVVAVAWTLIRNLPGLLDLAGFRNAGIELGTRYAIVTICQYALGALALLSLSRLLGLDWSQFGWIAAALSLGLGFGLQEVVANFVCGIILLFERPIRLGDVVTINGVTGTVSKIKMRATTITNWDRQDFVVPNKDLITGSLVNWTLLSPINRIVIEVGIAYGSDTEEAMRILRDVAQEHPMVMEDPAPLISFEAFGDSSLNLCLRCYLPSMDTRLKTTTELHSEINLRYAAAGIEIPFPQQDVYVRGMMGQEAKA